MQLQLIIPIVLFAITANSGVRVRTPASQQSIRLPGTFSNLNYNEDGGDLLGLEIKIVPVVGERYQAAVIVSNGEPQPMRVVDVRVNGRTISFEVRDDDASWSFTGTVSTQSLKGTITHRRGGKEAVTLRRGCGYWEE